MALPASGPISMSMINVELENSATTKLSFQDVATGFDLDSPNTDSTTLGGYVMDLAKKIPLYGETISDQYFKYKVLSHSRKQILRLEITKIK